MPAKLISNRALREFAALHAEAAQPLQDFRRKVEKGSFGNFAQLRAVFPAVDKVVSSTCSTSVATSSGWWRA